VWFYGVMFLYCWLDREENWALKKGFSRYIALFFGKTVFFNRPANPIGQ
jgi:hypothetical protein